MQKNNNKLTMSARFGEWYKEATENCAERELYATSLIARMDWVVDPISSKSYRYDLTTDLNKNHSSAWYDVATEICNKWKRRISMYYPTTKFDQYGARQLPKEDVSEEIDETADYDKDSMGETIAQEDGVFEILYTVTTVMSNRCLKIKTEKAIVTQQDIVDFILEIGEEKITSIKFVGLGEKYLEIGGNYNGE